MQPPGRAAQAPCMLCALPTASGAPHCHAATWRPGTGVGVTLDLAGARGTRTPAQLSPSAQSSASVPAPARSHP
eukprot:14446092-Alexandrium_andersonii.AAC.1